MNQHLQALLNLLQQNTTLTAEEKESIAKYAKAANKELDITAFKLKSTEKVKRTTTILLEETIEELESKRKAVEAQNRELEIETALERVRAVAMSMNKAEDMLDVCKTICQQLALLNVKEIRNVQTAIFYTGKGTYMNYEYYAKHDKTLVTETTYSNNERHAAFAEQMQKGDGESIELHITDLHEWIAYQQTTNVFIDEFLYSAPSLDYYWYSLGPVALGISTYKPLTGEEKALFRRFLKVFALAYRRYFDIEQAEAQAREAKIEAAMEKIRSRSLAMHQSNELKEVMAVMFQRLTELNVLLGTVAIQLFDPVTKDCTFWIGNDKQDPEMVKLPYDEQVISEDNYMRDYWNARVSGESFFNRVYSFEQKNKYFRYVFANNDEDTIPLPVREFILKAPSHVNTLIIEKNSALFADNYNNQLYTEGQIDVLKRTAKVFDQAYVRFLDLQKAEAQAREAKIEAALEKVRSRTMAMQKSEELSETSSELVKQVMNLGIPTWHCAFNIYDEGEDSSTEWGSSADVIFPTYKTPRINIFRKYYELGQAGETLHTEFIEEGRCARHYDFLCTLPVLGEQLLALKNAGLSFPTSQFDNVAYFQYGYLLFITYQPVPDAHDIFKRFAKVFEQAYTRFLDLKNAEAQARESQVEAALERVRSRTMAMQSSNELAETASVMFRQIKNLGVSMWSCGFCTWQDDAIVEAWMGAEAGGLLPALLIPYKEEQTHRDIYEAKLLHKTAHEAIWEGNALQEHYAFLQRIPSVKTAIEQLQQAGLSLPARQYYYVGFFKQGYLLLITTGPDKNALDISKRFAAVFDLTYTRFLDLKNAEAQAREAQIEAALERVRSVAMGMSKSTDLQNICEAVFTQLCLLGFNNMRAAQIYIRNDEDEEFINYDYSDVTGAEVVNVKYNSHANTKRIFDIISNAGDALVDNMIHQQELEEWKNYLYHTLGQPPEEKLNSATELHYYLYSFGKGAFGISNFTSLSNQDLEVLKRFKNVFSFCYQRFSDISLAEERAGEAIKRASVDRLRAEIASMRTTADLERITPLLWNELTMLGIPFTRCGVFIIDEDNQVVQTMLSTPDGKAIATMHVPFGFDLSITSNGIANWRRGKMYIEHWDKDVFITSWGKLAALAGTQSDVSNTEDSPESLYLHQVPFLQGMLYVGNDVPLTEDELGLVQNLADAFAAAYARYEDFNKLETAKKQVDSTLTELKAAQKQLVQSEKMASLGELTAGIAHEIQNPLNFVNNFSEVSRELLEELQEERLKAEGARDRDLEDEILTDIKQNLDKINHHGKRADAIVKGMLQHSKTGSGIKEPVNINALADEFLRIAYHGFRSKDGTLNVEMVCHYAEGPVTIKAVTADIGRVMLNVFNNAFYAVSKKTKTAGHDYKPEVLVTTLQADGFVIIKVKDNGTGIPDAVKGKIYQPFFTTKSTGEGTGLGLSLSYDIVVKGYNGKIDVDSKEGAFTEFTIKLPVQ